MSLSTLPSEVTTLNTLSKQDEIVPGMLDIGTDLEPRLRLYLSNNILTKIPSPVLDLRNLRYLSLRNNNLTSVSPGIRDLANLECLNIAGNQLTELPSEVLDLASTCHLKELIVHPNPWEQCSRLSMIENLPSAIRRINNGNLFLWNAPSAYARLTDHQLRPLSDSSVPSLTELVLRQLCNLDPQGETVFADYMPSGSPQPVLDHLKFLGEHPGRRCASCKRTIVLASEEQLEWWNVRSGCSGDELTESPSVSDLGTVPFRHVFCSTPCRAKRNTSVHIII